MFASIWNPIMGNKDKMNIQALPPLPSTKYALATEGDRYDADRIWSEAAYTAEQMRDYATAAVLAEREACAKAYEENWQHVTASAIRARSNPL